MAEHLAKRKELWEEQSVSRQVVAKPQGGRPSEFASETADVAGVDARTVQRAVSRAEGVTQEARDAIRGTEHDKGVVLDELKKLPATKQAEHVADIVRAGGPFVVFGWDFTRLRLRQSASSTGPLSR